MRLALLLLLIPAVACVAGSDLTALDAEPDAAAADDDRPEGPLHPDTFLVEDHPCFASAYPSDDNSVIDFEFDCDATDVAGLEVGRIVSGTEGGGYLRRIESLQFDGYTATAWTSPATLVEALVDVDYSDHIEWGARQVVDFSGRVLDESMSENGHDSRAIVERGIVNIDPTMDIDAEIRWFSLKSATAKLTVNLGYDVEALMEAGSSLHRADTIDLDTLVFPFETDVGPVTVTGKLDVHVRLRWEHTSEGGPVSDRFGFQGNGTVVMGGKYVKDGETWTRIWEPNYSGTLTDQVVSGAGDHLGKITVEIEAKLSMDKVDGSTFRYEPWNSGSVVGGCEASDYFSDAGIKGATTMHLGFFSDGPRVEEYPELNIEADRVEGTLTHPEPPVGCGDVDDEDGDPGDELPPPHEVPGECSVLGDVQCGGTIGGDTSTAGTSAMDGYSCNVGNYDGPEMTWRFVAPYTGQFEVAFEGAIPTEVNHDILILDGSSGSCLSTECIAQGFNSVTFEGVAGQAYFVVIDGYYLDAGPFFATVSCGS